jgi:hypothetical protein
VVVRAAALAVPAHAVAVQRSRLGVPIVPGTAVREVPAIIDQVNDAAIVVGVRVTLDICRSKVGDYIARRSLAADERAGEHYEARQSTGEQTRGS